MKAIGLTMMLAVAACGGDGDSLTPREACEGESLALCERLYTCMSAQELAAAGFPDQESACVTQLETAEGCSAQTVENTCNGNATYHASKAEQCVDQLAGIDCGQLRSADFDLAKVAPACDLVCSID